MKENIRLYYILLLLCIIILSCSGCQMKGAEKEKLTAIPDLVVYTCHEEEVYLPIIKEFQERTGLLVNVETGTAEELLSRIMEEIENPICDILFGIDVTILDNYKEYWEAYESKEVSNINPLFSSANQSFTSFSANPLVIMYNTKVVTYRELPTGWDSLLEERWKGRIAFADPTLSDIYLNSLITAITASPNKENYLSLFVNRLDGQLLSSLSEVNLAVSEGRYSLGVTLEESAQNLVTEGADVNFIYPNEGTSAIFYGTSIIKKAPHKEAATRFIDFTVSKDTQRILVNHLNRRSVWNNIPTPRGLLPIESISLIEIDVSGGIDIKNSILNFFDHYIDKKREGPNL